MITSFNLHFKASGEVLFWKCYITEPYMTEMMKISEISLTELLHHRAT